MHPVIRLFGLELNAYYTMMGLGFCVMVWLMLRRRRRFELRASLAVAFAVLVMLAGLTGCKLLYILENWRETLKHGVTLRGFSFFGAVFAVPPLMALFGFPFHLRPARSLDAAAPCVAAMIGTVRVGCFLNGCCGGRTALLFGRLITYPTQAMESIGDYLILLWLLSHEEKGSGGLYPRFLAAYGVLRFLIEFLRDTPKDWLWLSHGQWFSVLAVTVGALFLLKEKRRAGDRAGKDIA